MERDKTPGDKPREKRRPEAAKDSKAAAQVLFLPSRASDSPLAIGERVARLFAALGLERQLPPRAMVAVKIHLGERGRPAPVPPSWIRPLITRLEKQGAHTFLTDSCTLYRGGRSNAIAHLRLATERGFTLEGAGAPFIVADGLLGEASIEVPIAGHHHRTVHVAQVAVRATALVTLSHFTGHMGTSFGAAIKNLGMGLAARAGKLQQHAVAKPSVDTSACAGCGVCLEVCAADAIDFADGVARIDPQICTGCGQCITVCYTEGIRADYGAGTKLLQERIAEHALGVVQGKAGLCAHLSFLMKVTPNCDCLGQPEPALFTDIGILASEDPVAIDQAACDLVIERTGKPIHHWCGRELDPDWQLAHSEAIGLGTRRYELRELPLA